jgi:hypothetical protein
MNNVSASAIIHRIYQTDDEENQKQGIIDIENEYLILKGVQEFTTNKIRKLIYLTRHKIHRLNQLIWIIMFC